MEVVVLHGELRRSLTALLRDLLLGLMSNARKPA